MPFVKYRKIHRLGTEETEGILLGSCFIQEKIDGANTQIWKNSEFGKIECGTRNHLIGGGDSTSFNGFLGYVRSHKGIESLLGENPTYRLYGEWLVRHTIHYKETAYREFYLFDVLVGDTFMDCLQVSDLAVRYGLKTPHTFGVIQNPTIEQINAFVGKSALGDHGEGVVIKNFQFKNKFGDLEYAKVVVESFKERNRLVFGDNSKHSTTYWEMYVVNKYMSLPRVQKIMNKIQPLVDHKLGLPDTSRIVNTAYHDMMTEEIWEITRKVKSLDFDTLKHLAMRKATQIYHDIITNTASVADLPH